MLVVGAVLIPHVALAPLHPADDGEGQAAVLTQGHRHRAAQARPGRLAGVGIGGAGGIVRDGDPSAPELDGADAGIVVGQRGGLGLAPAFAPVKGLAAVDAVSLPVAHKGHQVPRFQLHHVGVHMAVGAGHHHHPPALALVVRDAEGGGVPRQPVRRVGAQPVGKDPPSIAQHLDGLAAEGALLGEHRLIGPPGAAAVAAFLAADHGGVLHVVLPFLAVQLGGIHGPHRPVGAVKQRGVLFAAGGVPRNVHRGQPGGGIFGQQRADDVDISAALIAARKPAAQQAAVGQFHHGGSMGCGVAAGGQQGFHRAHLVVLIQGAVPGQAEQFGIGHRSIVLSSNRSCSH